MGTYRSTMKHLTYDTQLPVHTASVEHGRSIMSPTDSPSAPVFSSSFTAIRTL